MPNKPGPRLSKLLPYYGSKSRLAPRIAHQLGPHRLYAEACCGSLAVLMGKPVAPFEMVCDLYGHVVNLARVVASERWRDLYEQARRIMSAEPLYDELRASVAADDPDPAPSVEAVEDRHVAAALAVLASSWIGRNGYAGTTATGLGFAQRYTTKGSSNAARWTAAVESIPFWHQRIRDVQIVQADLFDWLPRIVDAPDVAIYVDPPYIDKDATYQHDFTGGGGGLFGEEDDHDRLARLLRSFSKSRVVVSYYDHPRLAELYPGWTIVPVPLTKTTGIQTRGEQPPRLSPEVLIVNGPEIPAADCENTRNPAEAECASA